MDVLSVNMLFPAFVTHQAEGKECECLVFLDMANKKVYLAHSWSEYEGDNQSIFDNLTQQMQGFSFPADEAMADMKSKYKEMGERNAGKP
jgi:hypothetical protein